MHTVVFADFDTGALNVHTFLDWNGWLECDDPHVRSVGCGQLTTAQLIANIENTFRCLEEREAERKREAEWYAAHPDEI